MTNELMTVAKGEIVTGASVAEAGIVANVVASRNVFADYTQRKSTNSLRAQRSDLATFAQYLSAAGTLAPSADDLQGDPGAWLGVTWGLVAGFVQWMLGEGLALTSINRKLSTVKVYAGMAAQAKAITGDELSLIKTVKGYAGKEFKRVDDKRIDDGQATRTGHKKQHGAALTPEQAKSLKEQPDTAQGRRDAVIMALLLDHGLRVGELAGLQSTSVNLKTGEMQFYRSKVSRTQTHKLTRDALAALRAYMPDAPAMGPLLRASRKGGELTEAGMTERSISIRVGQMGSRIGVDGLSAHDCRHFWATRAIRKGASPFAVLQAGGWTSMQTVQKYVDETIIANAGIDDD